jgi:hypothetical protein
VATGEIAEIIRGDGPPKREEVDGVAEQPFDLARENQTNGKLK